MRIPFFNVITKELRRIEGARIKDTAEIDEKVEPDLRVVALVGDPS